MFPQLAHIPNDLISYFLTGKAISNNVAGLLWLRYLLVMESKQVAMRVGKELKIILNVRIVRTIFACKIFLYLFIYLGIVICIFMKFC